MMGARAILEQQALLLLIEFPEGTKSLLMSVIQFKDSEEKICNFFSPNLAENIFDVRITVIFLQGSGEKDSKSLLITSRGKISFVTIMKTL